MKVEFKRPSITVGIVAFNTPIETFRATLISLMNSSVELSIVCLCNSPEERYQTQIIKICAELSFECISNQPNRGFGAGHNTIWRKNKSEWYVCCNPDVLVQKESIERLIEFGMAAPKSGLLMPKVLNLNGTVQPLARRHLTFSDWITRQVWRLLPRMVRPFEVRFDYSRSQAVEFVTGCFFAVRRGILIELDGFDEQYFLYAEDADLSRRAAENYQNWYVGDSVVTHKWSTKWGTNPSAVYHEFKSLRRYFKKFSRI